MNAPQRIHCISAGTALRAQAMPEQEPELGYPSLAQLPRRAGVTDEDDNFRDMRELFRRMVFNILIDNTDDHEKNHALRLVAPMRQRRYRLAPAYDILPTNSATGWLLYPEFVHSDECFRIVFLKAGPIAQIGACRVVGKACAVLMQHLGVQLEADEVEP
jgi:hypothetical protein